MFSSSKWWFGFIPGALFLLWCVFFLLMINNVLIINNVSEGEGFALLFLTEGILVLLTLLMLVLVCFRNTRPVSFGLAVPLLVPDAWLIYLSITLNNNQKISLEVFLAMFLYALPAILALLVIAITYFTRPRARFSHHPRHAQ